MTTSASGIVAQDTLLAPSWDRAQYNIIVRMLRRERAVRGISQREVAERMGTSQSAVSDIESLRVIAQTTTLLRYANAIGCRVTVTIK